MGISIPVSLRTSNVFIADEALSSGVVGAAPFASNATTRTPKAVTSIS